MHYFNGKSLTNPILYTSKDIILTEVTLQGKSVYYEAYRAPVGVVIFGLLTLFYAKPLFLYLIILWVAFLIAVYKFRKDVKFDTLITFAVLLSPYIIKTTFFLSSEEILSIIFVMLSLGLLIKEKPLAGVTLGIASLAKYPTIILLPTILLLYKPKKIIKGFLLEFLVILPWLVFNFVISGNPFTSYIQSYATVLGSASSEPIFLSTLTMVFGYSVVLGIIYLIVLAKIRFDKKKLPNPFSLRDFKGTKLVIMVFFVLSLLQWLLIAGHYDTITQARYAYLLALMTLILLAYVLSEEQKVFYMVKYIVFVASILVLIYFIVILNYDANYLVSYNPNSNQSIFYKAQNKIVALGYGNCRLISNAWPYLRYLGLNAYMPFYENSTADKYPIIIFNSVGVNASETINNLNQTRIAYSDKNFSVLIPYNYSCYTN